MEVSIKVKVEGLEPITEAITNLAAAISLASNASATATTAVIEKAKGNKSKATTSASTQTPAETTSPVPDASSGDSTDPKSAATADSQPTTTTDVASAADPKSTPDEAPSGTASTQTESGTTTTAASGTTISDEELRSLAGKAAAKDKEKTKALINKYATAVSLVPAEVRPVLVKELEAVA